MIICGLKLTHDGSVALIDNGRLVFNIELEKINNNKRYTGIEDTAVISGILADHGYAVESVDRFVVDGWGGSNVEALAIQPRLEVHEQVNRLSAKHNEKDYAIDIAQYHERTLQHNVLEEWRFDGLRVDGRVVNYKSYLHVTGHILSAYCSSPFAKRNESSFVLIWDGGMYPRLYYFHADTRQIENFGPIFLLIGNIYTIFSQHFGPFKVKGNFAKDDLSIAGKVMAYIALGTVKRELFKYFDDIYAQCYDNPMGFANTFAQEFRKRIEGQGYSDEDILCSFHTYLEELLVAKIEKKVQRLGRGDHNLCYAGGCALNIKWNSAVRASGVFKEVYVPPFPNDSGSAIGAACGAMVNETGNITLDWSVYSGPKIVKNEPTGPGWTATDCDIKRLAHILHTTKEPVVFLNGKAELGPRALGNRSIIAAPDSPTIKATLNKVKAREQYRPVSPICLEHKAQEIFDPGVKDPYMLFDHFLRREWVNLVPGVLHLDGTSRLQTVNDNENKVVAELLEEYFKLSGIPLLCNTSANYNGSGFFPDVSSATKWNQVNYVWCDNTLYERIEKIVF